MIIVSIEADGLPSRRVVVPRLPCRIGRRKDNEIVLDSWRVARVHALIERMERGFRLVDAGALSGTWVNGERIVEFGPLDAADEIVISGFRLRMIAGTQADADRMDGLTEQAGEAPQPQFLDLPDPPVRPTGWADAPARADASAGAPGASHGGGTALTEGASAASVDPVLAAPEGSLAPGWAADSPHGNLPLMPQSHQADHRAWRVMLHQRLLQTIDLRRKDVRQLSSAQLRADARLMLQDILRNEDALPAHLNQPGLIEDTLDEVVGLGPLERLMADAAVSEIMVNSAHEIFVERAGVLQATSLSFSSEAAVRAVIERIVAPIGRRIDESSPMVDARLADGSRVNAIIPPLAVKGSALTIRRFGRQMLHPDDLVRLGSANERIVAFLKQCIVLRRNLVIAGGTGSGKTTLLNLLASFIPPHERLVTIEDAAELSLNHPNLVRLEARPANSEGRGQVAIRDLVRNALRMRPDRIIVGECRGGEALDMLQAMNTGHDGSLTTVHANSARDVIARLETMVLMAGMDLPLAAIREQIASAVEIIVQQARSADGRRRVVEITEVTGTEGSRVLMQPLFRWRRGVFEDCGNVPHFLERLGLPAAGFLGGGPDSAGFDASGACA
ncbi:MAG: Flp pilus assembly complex ATPase component TadA [Burkholderiaceae bacterium]|nr:Flp pilus assembly complex ATPase component TadA [Burkholderiaceae bacterium]